MCGCWSLLLLMLLMLLLLLLVRRMSGWIKIGIW